MQNCVFTGVSYSSPTLASAMGQLIPAFTFLLAVIFRFLSSFFHCTKSRRWELSGNLALLRLKQRKSLYVSILKQISSYDVCRHFQAMKCKLSRDVPSLQYVVELWVVNS
jgi:hypothetical protein